MLDAKWSYSNGFTSSNCIDLVLVSTLDLIWDISVVEPFSSSCDHSAIHFSVSYPVEISDNKNNVFLTSSTLTIVNYQGY